MHRVVKRGPSLKSLDLGIHTGLQKVLPYDKIYVAMSGGVDSSTVAGLLAHKFGKSRVHGVYMNNWSSNSKCQERNWNSVKGISSGIGIGCHRVDFEKNYWTDVFEPMLNLYQNGLTPNPDVSCNHFIKFGKLIEHLKDYDPEFKWIASGHYAGIDSDTQLVRRAGFTPKDQSYYLATVRKSALRHILLPFSNISKPKVRELARELELGDEVACKPDSQGLCFVEQQAEVGQRGFSNFLSEYLEKKPGPIVLASNKNTIVGEHQGIWTHTIGQRASVSLPQHLPEFRGQWFVVSKDIESNSLVIDRKDSPLLDSSTVVVDGFEWYKTPSKKCVAQYRSLQKPWNIDSFEFVEGKTVFYFSEPRKAVAPGQYLVVYENDVVIGAGTISNV